MSREGSGDQTGKGLDGIKFRTPSIEQLSKSSAILSNYALLTGGTLCSNQHTAGRKCPASHLEGKLRSMRRFELLHVPPAPTKVRQATTAHTETCSMQS